MRRFLSYSLSVLITLSLSACGQAAPMTSTATQKPAVQTFTPAMTSSDQKPATTTEQKPTDTVASTAAKTESLCRPDALAGVYHPSRLEIKEACKTVSGTVQSVRHEKDGDYHINLKLDDQYVNLINDKNEKDEHGNLVVEIIPLDEPYIPVPKKDQHITVTGSYVLDKHHGWMEIHPAWIIDSNGSASYDKGAAEKSAASPSDEDEQPEAKAEPVTQPKAIDSAPSDDNIYYKNCTAVKAAGKAPLHRGDSGYRSALDRDNDGIACEK